MQQVVNMPRHATRCKAVPDAVRQHHAGNIVTAREHCGKITATVSPGRNGNQVAFESGQYQRTMRFLVAGPQLHASERTHCCSRAIQLFWFDLLELHDILDSLLSAK